MPKGTDDHVGFFAPQSKHIYSAHASACRVSLSPQQSPRTLFAAFPFSFLKISCDCVFVASAMAKTV